jgi:hypothetical protein
MPSKLYPDKRKETYFRVGDQEECNMTKKEKCKAIMLKLFGPATAKSVDNMSENDCVTKCREKVLTFHGEEAAKEFDLI